MVFDLFHMFEDMFMETIENWLSSNLYVQWGSLYERTVRGPGHSQLIKINGQGIQYTRVHNHCHIRFYLSLIPNKSWLNFTACRYIKSRVLFAVSIFCYRNIFSLYLGDFEWSNQSRLWLDYQMLAEVASFPPRRTNND